FFYFIDDREREGEGELGLLFCLFITGDLECEGEATLFLSFCLGGLRFLKPDVFYVFCTLFGDYE
ncbi:MAG: hypothetical protein ACKO96_05295, partial [Flammeovirgaceae bacterium]